MYHVINPCQSTIEVRAWVGSYIQQFYMSQLIWPSKDTHLLFLLKTTQYVILWGFVCGKS